jgi:hypothetical protein
MANITTTSSVLEERALNRLSFGNFLVHGNEGRFGAKDQNWAWFPGVETCWA